MELLYALHFHYLYPTIAISSIIPILHFKMKYWDWGEIEVGKIIASAIKSDNAEFLSDRREFLDSLLDILLRVRGGYLHADAGFSFWYDGECEADDVDAFVEKRFRHIDRPLLVAEHDWGDGVLCIGDGKTVLFHEFAEEFGIRPQALAIFGMVFQIVDDKKRRARNRSVQRIGKEIATRAITQVFSGLFARRSECAARTTQGLAERAGDKINAADNAARLGCAAARLSHNAGRMCIVHEDERLIFVREVANFFQRGDITVHAVHAVGRNDP